MPEVETDRARFLGRGHDVHRPIAVVDGRPLSNTVGTVLDPVFALRRRVRIAPGATVHVAFWTAVAGSRASLLHLVDKLRDSAAFERAGTLAWTQAQVQLHHLGIEPGEAALFQRLAGHLLHAGPDAAAVFRHHSPRRRRPVCAVAHGISGDLPILLLRIADVEHLELARQLLQAHEYWRMKRLAVDLVIVNERASSYVQDLQDALETLVRARQPSGPDDVERRQGRVFALRADLLAPEARALLPSVARVVLVGQRGSLADQLDRVPERRAAHRKARRRPAPPRNHGRRQSRTIWSSSRPRRFRRRRAEYVTISGRASPPPRPGSMSSPIPISAFRWRPRAAASPGR